MFFSILFYTLGVILWVLALYFTRLNTCLKPLRVKENKVNAFFNKYKYPLLYYAHYYKTL